MKGKKFYLLLMALVCVGAMTFAACNTSNKPSGGNSAQEQDTRIENVYAQYVAYAQQNGQTPMSYEQWLATIKGEDGKSAYEVWLENGYTGTPSDFLEWLKGQKGDQGETGAQGPQGEQGEQGVGIQSIAMDANGDWVVTYTDGTIQTIAVPKEETHVHSFTSWLMYDENEGLLYRICDDCKAVEWTSSIAATTAGALILAANQGGMVMVARDIALETAIYVTKDLTVNLNANISIPTDTVGDGVFCVKKGTLTLEGEGTVNGKSADTCDYNMALWADGGNIVINGGTYTTEGAKSYDANGGRNNNELIYVKNGGKVTINGGTFIGENPAYTLNSHDSQVGTIEVKGGKFYKFNPATDANDATVYVAEGYTVVKNGDWYEVVKA